MPSLNPLKVTLGRLDDPQHAGVDLMVVGVASHGLDRALAHPALAAHAQTLQAVAHREDFSGKAKEQLSLWISPPAAPKKRAPAAAMQVVLVGVGALESAQADTWLRLGGTLTRLMATSHSLSAALVLPAGEPTYPTSTLCALAQGLHLGRYSYTTYKTQTPDAPAKKKEGPVRVAIDVPATAENTAALHEGAVIADAVATARDLVNSPPNALYPASFAAEAKKRASKLGVRVKVMGPSVLKKMNMGMLLGVGQGSDRPPQLVHLTYKGRRAPNAPTVLVGKGITFDSGGLCIKTCDGMGTMKMDMGGAAAVLATVLAAAALKAPVHVHGVLALAENMPAGNALRPGDVLQSAKGLTVEVNNTDAEGRLVLGDALHYAVSKLAPARVIDVATLTGACMVALGSHTTGVFASDDALAQDILAAARAGGESMWRMPLTPSLSTQLKSDIADMRNTGDRYGGAITAALFLQRFVGKTPWAHLDIAGPAWSSEDHSTLRRGGTGASVSTLVRLLLAQDQAPPAMQVPARKRGRPPA